MKIENLCNFYASKYHLSITLIEYLKKINTQKNTIITFFEEGIEDEIKCLNQKYKFNMNITNEGIFEETKDIKTKKINEKKNMIFIILGNTNYMEEANEYIINNVQKFKNSNIKIINCFDFETQKMFMQEILDSNDKILYTTGEKVID